MWGRVGWAAPERSPEQGYTGPISPERTYGCAGFQRLTKRADGQHDHSVLPESSGMSCGVVTLRVSATSLVRSQPRDGKKRNRRETAAGPDGRSSGWVSGW